MAFTHVEPSPGDNLGELIRQARKRAGMRQTDLAAAVHAGLSSVAAWERGQHIPPADVVLALAVALGVRFIASPGGAWLMEDDPPTVRPGVIVAGTVEAMREALDRLGVPPAD